MAISVAIAVAGIVLTYIICRKVKLTALSMIAMIIVLSGGIVGGIGYWHAATPYQCRYPFIDNFKSTPGA
jgi:hypothetical protein